jgi:ATP-binding cassette subfamily B protein
MITPPLVWLLGGRKVFSQEMTLGEIVAYSGYLMMLFRPIFTLTRLAQMIPDSLAAADRVFDVIEAEPEITDAPDAVAMPEMAGGIELREVSFEYETGKPVLDDVSATIAPGEMIGLIGHSGAGKSTTINLLSRLYDVKAGSILIDGVDLRKIRMHDLRAHMGVVLQETFLFNGTVADNIAYARPDAAPLEIVEAAKVANAHEFILRKPDGYDTEVVGGGSNFSVGEKQRISIARAVLADPRILILDEATGNVDLETEKKIQEALNRLVKGRTTIAIAHRLSTLRNADRLIVLDKGKVAEIGSHAELIEEDGIYAKLVRLQKETSEVMGVGG